MESGLFLLGILLFVLGTRILVDRYKGMGFSGHALKLNRVMYLSLVGLTLGMTLVMYVLLKGF